MALTHAINLYITTCRYVIRSNPYDAETWTELYRYLPYLRQSLSCCVCAQVLHIPMGPADSPCQHHVCRACLGGKMRLRPTCAWCKNHDEFMENSILRTVIQCFKKLCEYLASSAIAVELDSSKNCGTNSLMTAIQDGIMIKDDYNSPSTPALGLFPPKLHRVNSRRASKEEQNKQFEKQLSSSDKGEGQSEGIIPSIVRGTSPSADEVLLLVEDDTKEGENDAIPVLEQETISPSATETTKKRKRRSGRSDKQKKNGMCNAENGEQTCEHVSSMSMELDGLNDSKPDAEHSLYETVTSEHDYNIDIGNSGEKQNSTLKVRIRKIEGDHESLVKKTKHVAEPILCGNIVPLKDSTDTVTNAHTVEDNGDQNDDSLVLNNNTPTKEVVLPVQEDQVTPKNRLSLNKKKIVGCRCGLATPNPGKLTCCGQRCPCYSSFKGCVDCRCRGCRNPRGDTPSPHSLKSQLQKQQLHTQTILTLGPNPQIILTPIKVENEESDIDIDV